MSALSIRGLRKTYANRLEALKGIDLDVQQGDFFALLGPNGAGKSTTIGIISSLVTKTAGSVSIFGHDLDAEPEMAKASLGLVPQEINFNQFETAQNIVATQAGYYGIRRREAHERAEHCLRELGLWDKRHQVSRQLSGGMKRRLMIARALVHSPRLLILDEPTAGVDIEIRRSMWSFLSKINREGTTIILTTHYLEEAESLCRNIAIIDHGSIVENTDMPSLLGKLDEEEFVLNLRQPVSHLPRLPVVGAKLLDPCSLEVAVTGKQGLNELFLALDQAGIQVVSMRNKTNRLEQLFMRIVENGRAPVQRNETV